MSEFMPHFAPIVVLLFLGTLFLIGISFLVLLYGVVRRSSFLAKIGAAAAFTVAIGYLLLLSGVSVASSEKTLSAGDWKYFCEIDCHLAYSLIGTQTTAELGPEMRQVSAHGKFVVVRVKTWFDEHTISAHRGNGPLTPNRRKILLADDMGRSFAPSAEGEMAFARISGSSTPLTQPLRPGESYTTDFVFDLPKEAHGLRLLITEDDPETRVVIGHENSLMHKKIYFNVDSAPPLVKASQ
jgi:hypothetical protein